MLEKLSGYKTYICAGLYVLVTALDKAGVLHGLDASVVQLAEAALAAGGLASLRAGVAKAEGAAKS